MAFSFRPSLPAIAARLRPRTAAAATTAAAARERRAVRPGRRRLLAVRRGPLLAAQAPPVCRQLLSLYAAVDLEPAQRLLEVAAAGQHVLHARRAVHLAQPALGRQH